MTDSSSIDSGLLAAVLRVLPQGVVVIDPDSRVMIWNRQFERIFSFPAGYVREGLPFAALTRWIAERRVIDVASLDETMRRRLRDPIDGDVFDLPLADGRHLEIRRHSAPDGSLVTTYFDITERRRLEERLREDATIDPLTGLGNRLVFDERIKSALGGYRASDTQGALVLMDLNRFKAVNDVYGHPAGDALLIHVVSCLRQSFRASDSVARLGGDEFAVICPGPQTVADAVRPIDKLLTLLDNEIDVDGATIRASIAIGVALYPEHGQESADLYAAADQALYRAKGRGSSSYELAQVGDVD